MRSLGPRPIGNGAVSARTYVPRSLESDRHCARIVGGVPYALVGMYQQFRNLLVDEGITIAEDFAHASLPVFVVNDISGVKRTAAVFRSFEGVQYLAILERDLSIRYEEGVGNGRLPKTHPGIFYDHGRLLGEDMRNWRFIAPIVTEGVDGNSPYMRQRRPEKEIMGYVLVDYDKGRLRWLMFVLVPINVAIGVVVSILLITWARAEGLKAQKDYLESEVAIRTQEALAARDAAVDADRQKQEFLATVTHEMRTPLNGIIGNAQLALEALKPYDDRPNEAELDTILKNGRQLLALINNILDATALEAGQVKLKLEEVDLKGLIESAVETVHPFVLRNRNRLEFHFNGNGVVIIDRMKLLQILLNLLSNAAKFTHHGHIALHIESAPSKLFIQVRDTGIGVADQEHKSQEPRTAVVSGPD
jgi:signal transduction histidine kinase